MRRLVVADIGSTTTKAVLFHEEAGGWQFTRRESPTTVEAPHADVKVGLRAALAALGEASGLRLLEDDRPAVPLLLTSSAGGGLAMVVTGLVRAVSSRSAERAALGAGAVLLDTVALDDGRVPYRKILDLERLRPDMILLAGGFDGEAISGPVFLSELLRQAVLRPKLSPTARLPVVYAGNKHAEQVVRETLGDRYLFRSVPNLRPASDEENLEDARHAIHELFMEHVMSHAPGYAGLESWVETDILPTPSAVARILETVTEDRESRILAIDIGGATTDVFTAAGGNVFRTVSANLGMSYSALHVAATGGMKTILESLPSDCPESEAWNRVGAKHLRPTRLPPTEADVRLEWALATAAVRQAVRDHLEVLRGTRLSRGEEELSLASVGRKRRRSRQRDPLPLEGYDLVVGSGGILSHSPRTAAATILANALEPRGSVDLAVDVAFVLPHLGAVSRVDPDLARTLFRTLALVPLGSLVAPVVKTGKQGGTVHVRGLPGESLAVPTGTVRAARLPPGETAGIDLRAKGAKLDRRDRTVRGGELGLLLDTRLRPLADRRAGFHDGPAVPPADDRPAMPPGDRVRRGVLRERRELAVDGDVHVAVGDDLSPDAVVARSTRLFPRPFFLDAAGALEVHPDEVEAHLRKGPGDEVAVGEVLAERPGSGLRGPYRFQSAVTGRIDRLLPNGTLVVRERPDHADKPAAIDAARDLDIRPSQLADHLRVEIGSEVDRGQEVARRIVSTGYLHSRSPVRGTVRSIDEEFGIVLVAPLRQELSVDAWLPGRVVEVTSRGAVLEAEGFEITGAWGTGAEAAGPLAIDRTEPGCVAVLTAPRPGDLARLRDARVAALITGGLDLLEIRELAPTFPVILTEGFGVRPPAVEIVERLASHDGRLALVNGTTELRVGVRRPRILLPAV